MTEREIMAWIENHIFMPHRREFLRNDNTVTHYRDTYNNGDVYEWKSEIKSLSREHCDTWINGKLVDSADYVWKNFGWHRVRPAGLTA